MYYSAGYCAILLWFCSLADRGVVAAAAEAEAASVVVEESQLSQQQRSSVTVLGLGNMGTAVLRCLVVQKNVVVHAWNRGVDKREAIRDVAHVYETAEAAVLASNVTLILIDDWEGSVKLIKDMDRNVWKDRTIVLFSTYTPTDIQKLEQDMFQDGTSALVGGAIVGVPQTMCSQKALILTTAHVPVLETLGRTVAFTGDVGLAALANMALILVITFGVAGQELAHLIIQQYGANDQFLQLYIPLSAEIGPDYTKMLLPMVSRSISSKDYARSYVPVRVFRRVLQMHVAFMSDLGIADDTFLATYLRYLEKVPNGAFGPAAWIEQAVVPHDRERAAHGQEEL
jgi:3-hydroxyisobutyrate dehydrogenase-like beta-hydroxyacid dehydrogenase